MSRIVRALTVHGKSIDPKDLVKRLGKASQVVLFHGQAEPDPYYLKVFREDVVVFVGPADKLKAPIQRK
ncbi:MAG: hypothetical protein ACJ8FY_09365 [Gemmataceae bacterium]